MIGPVTMEEAKELFSEGELPRARDMLEVLAEDGFAEAMYMLGLIYRDGGRGIVPDIDESRRWFSRASRSGDERARSALLALNSRNEYITIFSQNGYEGNYGGEMSRYRR